MHAVVEDAWKAQMAALGAFIRNQRQLSELTLRQLASLTNVSNAYLSQLERGRHQPSMRVLSAIAEALHLPPDQLLAKAGVIREPPGRPAPAERPSPEATEAAIRNDPALSEEQKQALLAVYRSYRSASDSDQR